MFQIVERPISLSLLTAHATCLSACSFDPGTGFLQDAGYTVAAVSWELGHGVELPTQGCGRNDALH